TLPWRHVGWPRSYPPVGLHGRVPNAVFPAIQSLWRTRAYRRRRRFIAAGRYGGHGSPADESCRHTICHSFSFILRRASFRNRRRKSSMEGKRQMGNSKIITLAVVSLALGTGSAFAQEAQPNPP